MRNSSNGFYDSSDYMENENNTTHTMPKDADANGAYCIALKGLYEINKIKQNWSDDKKFKENELYTIETAYSNNWMKAFE